MKLTQTLYRHNLYRWYKDKWLIQGNRRIIESPLISQLQEKGLTITEATIVADPQPVLPIVATPAPWAPPPPLDNTHPQWKFQPCYTFGRQTLLLKGHLQGQLLTNTVTFDGLPKNILDLVGVLDRQDQDQLVKRAILTSHIYDGYQVKLPKVINFAKLGQRFAINNPPRIYGIPNTRSIKLLIRNFIKLLETQSGDYDAMNRTHLAKPIAIVTTMKDEDLIKFDMNAVLLVTAKNPLPAFASPDEVSQTINASMPDLYPIKCTIDIPKSNVYEIENCYPVTNMGSHPHLHTLYLMQREQPPSWTKSQAINRAMVNCFTFAMARAKALYGDDVKTLPQPITVQCVQCSNTNVSLLAYQLNTLDMDSKEGGIKNMAWIEPCMTLYDRCEDVGGKVFLEGYNPQVFRHLLAFHLNGLSKRVLVAPPPAVDPQMDQVEKKRVAAN